MTRYEQGALRLIGALVLVAAIQPFSSFMQADEAGREFSRCVRACSDARRACDDLCTADCQMFPGSANKAQLDACIAACKATCAAESHDCKLVCEATQENHHVEEP